MGEPRIPLRHSASTIHRIRASKCGISQDLTVDGMVQVRQRNALGNITLLGYATSTDGVHWDKPILNQVDFGGSTENNLD